MITYQCKGEGRSFGIEYAFSRAGDTIPPHKHDAELAHSVECRSGRLAVCYEDIVRVVKAPGKTHIAWNQLHWITALEDGTVAFHHFIHGQPESYKLLSASELAGTL